MSVGSLRRLGLPYEQVGWFAGCGGVLRLMASRPSSRGAPGGSAAGVFLVYFLKLSRRKRAAAGRLRSMKANSSSASS